MADLSAGPLSTSSLPDSDGDPYSSVDLLTRAQNGDEAARNELCARYLPRLRRWAHGRLPIWAREHLDTEDIVQDTLLRSVRQLDAFTPKHEHAFSAYVCEALRNRLRDALRRAARRPAPSALPEDEARPIRHRSKLRSGGKRWTATNPRCSVFARAIAS